MKKAISALAALLASQALFAHDLFLNVHPFFLSEPGKITVGMNLAEAFPGKEVAWRNDKTLKFWMLGPDAQHELIGEQGKNPSLEISKPGTYVIVWNAIPSYIEIDAKEFNGYIEAEGYHNIVRLRESQGKQNAPGREKYTRFLKAILQAGKNLTENYKQRLGQKIEIIPLTNPYSLKPGSSLTVQVFFDGKPAAGVRAMATYDTYSKEDDIYAHSTETDAEGKAKFDISHPGLWMVRANIMQPLEGDSMADWQSFWTNCTFAIGQ